MRLIRGMLVVALALPAAAAEARTWSFRVLLDDREIGDHRFTLRTLGEERELRSSARFEVRWLFLSAYTYTHEALERWRGDCLDSLVARTDSNGSIERVSAARRGGNLVVERPVGGDAHAGCVMSFAYWNPRILRARQLLNSQTGELVPVHVVPQGEETIVVRGTPRLAQRHRILAQELRIDVWYAGEDWVALEAPAAGGRRLRYERTWEDDRS